MAMRFFTVAAALCWVLCTAVSRADDTSQALARRQTFVVQTLVDGQKADIGSGVVVARSGEILTIATAAHLVGRQDALRILDASRQQYYDVVGVSMLLDYDLALIRVRSQPAFPVEPAVPAAAQAGERVFLWGQPEESFWSLAGGVVQRTDAQIPGVYGSARIAIVCRVCTHGDSGSGVFDANGRFLGILTRAWSKPGGPIAFLEVEPAALITQEVQAQNSAAAAQGPTTP